jgi:ABC-type microcin C transport system permease subunit YejB
MLLNSILFFQLVTGSLLMMIDMDYFVLMGAPGLPVETVMKKVT